MGWDETWAKHWKHGRVDRKAEVDDNFKWFKFDKDDPHKLIKEVSVRKSTMVGSTYYGAIDIWTKDKGHEFVGVVVLTKVINRSRIAIKVMGETVGPHYYDCPASILKLLSPTDNEWALEWRRKCEEQIVKKKELNKIKKLGIGSIISFPSPFDTTFGHKKGDIITLRKYDKSKWQVKGCYCRWREKNIPLNYTIEIAM